MKTLHLHIGHSKTGTTYIQASLAQSIDILHAHGLAYPIDGDAQRRAARNAITSGNGRDILTDLPALQTWLDTHGRGDASVLVSSEYLFKDLYPIVSGDAGPLDLDTLADTVAAAGFARIRVLLFVREPHAMMGSEWQQIIKRGGGTEDLVAFAHRPEPFYTRMAADILDALSRNAIFDVTLRNYDHEKTAILDPVERWLDMAPGSLKRPAVPTLNRSLTSTELELQRQINLLAGGDVVISDAFVETLPDIRPDRQFLPPADADRLEHTCQPHMDRLNRALPDGEKLHFRHEPAADPQPGHALDPDQIAVLARIIVDYHAAAAQDRKARDDLQAMADGQAARIRDLDAQLARLAHDKAVAEDIARTRIAGLEDMLTDMETRRRAAEDTARTRIDALDRALKKAWRDPIPHLFEAYRRKIRAGLRKREPRG